MVHIENLLVALMVISLVDFSLFSDVRICCSDKASDSANAFLPITCCPADRLCPLYFDGLKFVVISR